MDLKEQRMLLAWWDEYNGDGPVTNQRLRDFYFDVVTDSCLYHYGVVFEVMDVIANGMFDPRRTQEAAPMRAPATKRTAA